eukprot:SAG31_NODE_2895_length_4940_cov_4.688494_3_plen_140_part_00
MLHSRVQSSIYSSGKALKTGLVGMQEKKTRMNEELKKRRRREKRPAPDFSKLADLRSRSTLSVQATVSAVQLSQRLARKVHAGRGPSPDLATTTAATDQDAGSAQLDTAAVDKVEKTTSIATALSAEEPTTQMQPEEAM